MEQDFEFDQLDEVTIPSDRYDQIIDVLRQLNEKINEAAELVERAREEKETVDGMMDASVERSIHRVFQNLSKKGDFSISNIEENEPE